MYRQFRELQLGQKFRFFIFKRGFILFTKSDVSEAIEIGTSIVCKFNANDLVEIIR